MVDIQIRVEIVNMVKVNFRVRIMVRVKVYL